MVTRVAPSPCSVVRPVGPLPLAVGSAEGNGRTMLYDAMLEPRPSFEYCGRPIVIPGPFVLSVVCPFTSLSK